MFTDLPNDHTYLHAGGSPGELQSTPFADSPSLLTADPSVHALAPEPTERWDAAVLGLRDKISAQNFELWFRPIACLRLDDSGIHLRAPNAFLRDWFHTHYLRVVLDELLRQHPALASHEVHWQVGESPDALPAPVLPAAPLRKRVKPAVSPGQPAVSPSRVSAPSAVSGPAIHVPPPALLARYTFQTFIVGPSNQLAEAASRAVSEHPASKYNPLFLYGGVGLGKTHLLHAIGHELAQRHPTWRIVYLKTETFMNEYIAAIRSSRIDEFRARYRQHLDVLLMDDIQYLGGKERTQDEFFHTFNALFESRRQIVVTADKYPHEIPDLEDRIRSRFQWGLIADIQPPDLETRIAILQKKAEAEQIDLPLHVAQFLAANIRSNVRELEGLLIRVAAFASLRQQDITIDFVKDTLRGFLAETSEILSIDGIQREVATYFGVSVPDLCGTSRQATVLRPRQVAMFLARKHCKVSYPELGKRFGGKDHTTVLSACRKIDTLQKTDSALRTALLALEHQLKA